jgi:hypothetical protein
MQPSKRHGWVSRGAEVGAGQIGRVHDGASRSSKYLTLQAPDSYNKNTFPLNLSTPHVYLSYRNEFRS